MWDVGKLYSVASVDSVGFVVDHPAAVEAGTMVVVGLKQIVNLGAPGLVRTFVVAVGTDVVVGAACERLLRQRVVIRTGRRR